MLDWMVTVYLARRIAQLQKVHPEGVPVRSLARPLDATIRRLGIRDDSAAAFATEVMSRCRLAFEEVSKGRWTITPAARQVADAIPLFSTESSVDLRMYVLLESMAIRSLNRARRTRPASSIGKN